MSRQVSLAEFVEAFSKWGKSVSADDWVFTDLSLDAEELEAAIREIELSRKWAFNWECNLDKYIPRYTYWGLPRMGFSDLRIRELYAFSRPTVPDE